MIELMINPYIKTQAPVPFAAGIIEEPLRSAIGSILLAVLVLAAIAYLIWKNRSRIREICTDENGKIDILGGLEKHFAQTDSGASDKNGAAEEISPDEEFIALVVRQKGVDMADMDIGKEIIREHVIFHGRVQGVGFRYQAMFAARNFDLTGWVENLPDGSVEMEVQGTPAGIACLMKHMRSGHWIRIDDMDAELIPVVPGERGFGVRGY